MAWFDGFEEIRFGTGDAQIFARHGGNRSKPALLLLHGFPQTHAIWHRVAQKLKDDYYLVMPDLRGYGDSSKAPGEADHANYSKRAMAQDLVKLMEGLGHREFFLCGHDRGGRVAHRLAVDRPERVRKLCLLDIAPTLDMYEATDMLFARYYYHWFHLIQPSPLPEMMIGPNAKQYLHAKLGGWGVKGLAHIEPQALAEYERCFCRAESIHAACEDYRASAGIDLDHDRESRATGAKVQCGMLVLWGEQGVIDKLFKPLALWRAQGAARVDGWSVPSGHYIPEELPDETAVALRQFFV